MIRRGAHPYEKNARMTRVFSLEQVGVNQMVNVSQEESCIGGIEVGR